MVAQKGGAREEKWKESVRGQGDGKSKTRKERREGRASLCVAHSLASYSTVLAAIPGLGCCEFEDEDKRTLIGAPEKAVRNWRVREPIFVPQRVGKRKGETAKARECG